jgi:hypothetical protein
MKVPKEGFEVYNSTEMRRSSSMPHIREISKNHSKVFDIKKASVIDIISTIESPSHWRYFLRKEQKKQEYLRTIKTGPFLGGIPHTGLGNTVGISWNNK